jgi:hypothetical protein
MKKNGMPMLVRSKFYCCDEKLRRTSARVIEYFHRHSSKAFLLALCAVAPCPSFTAANFQHTSGFTAVEVFKYLFCEALPLQLKLSTYTFP